MRKFQYRALVGRLVFAGLMSLPVTNAMAAVAVDLQKQSFSAFAKMVTPTLSAVGSTQSSVQEISREMDFNHTTHVRVQQLYAGVPVWGADAVMHIPAADQSVLTKGLTSVGMVKHGKANGTFYQGLEHDLGGAAVPEMVAGNSDKAVQHVIALHQAEVGHADSISQVQSTLRVYVDKAAKAHWVYHVQFRAQGLNSYSKPAYLVDATDLIVYKSWNDLHTLDTVEAGGFGGNEKTGMTYYDGLTGHLPSFTVQRDPMTKTCYLRDHKVIIRNSRRNMDASEFNCLTTVSGRNNLYWDGGVGDASQEIYNGLDAANGGYAPGNDAYYAAHLVSEMYQNWYYLPAVMDVYRKAMPLVIFEHDQIGSNAAWDGDHMVIGDGGDLYYPLSSLDVIAHEVGHGFTQNHGVLMYVGESGGLNESFSDMTAIATLYYATGKVDWRIGFDVVKNPNKALRYMNQPSLDCSEGKEPGDWCSIDNVSQLQDGMDPHFSSGIFNKVFYVLSTSPNWDVRKAFDIMVQANRYYWVYNTDFNHAACGVMSSAVDYSYDLPTVTKAFAEVGIDTSNCLS